MITNLCSTKLMPLSEIDFFFLLDLLLRTYCKIVYPLLRQALEFTMYVSITTYIAFLLMQMRLLLY